MYVMSGLVKFLHVLFSYTRIYIPLLLTFHLLSRCLFVFLQVKLPKVTTYN